MFHGVAKGGAYLAKPLDNVLSVIFPIATEGSTTESAMEACFLSHFQETQVLPGGEVQLNCTFSSQRGSGESSVFIRLFIQPCIVPHPAYPRRREQEIILKVFFSPAGLGIFDLRDMISILYGRCVLLVLSILLSMSQQSLREWTKRGLAIAVGASCLSGDHRPVYF